MTLLLRICWPICWFSILQIFFDEEKNMQKKYEAIAQNEGKKSVKLILSNPY